MTNWKNIVDSQGTKKDDIDPDGWLIILIAMFLLYFAVFMMVFIGYISNF